MANFPTLSVTPDHPLDPDGQLPEHEDSIVSSKAEAGYRQTRPRFTRFPRKWGVPYSLMPAADVASLRAFERDTVKGGADIFTWTHPSGSSYSVRFLGPVKYRSTSYEGRYEVNFTLEEA